MAIELEPELGGTGSSFFSAILAVEELAKVDASVSVFCDVQNTLIMDFFRTYGSQYLKEEYLPRLAVDMVSVSVPVLQPLSASPDAANCCLC